MVREIETEAALTYFAAIHLWYLMFRKISIFMPSIRKTFSNWTFIRFSYLTWSTACNMNEWKSVHSAFISKTDACQCNKTISCQWVSSWSVNVYTFSRKPLKVCIGINIRIPKLMKIGQKWKSLRDYFSVFFFARIQVYKFWKSIKL